MQIMLTRMMWVKSTNESILGLELFKSMNNQIICGFWQELSNYANDRKGNFCIFSTYVYLILHFLCDL